jgi:hypothetical protein
MPRPYAKIPFANRYRADARSRTTVVSCAIHRRMTPRLPASLADILTDTADMFRDHALRWMRLAVPCAAVSTVAQEVGMLFMNRSQQPPATALAPNLPLAAQGMAAIAVAVFVQMLLVVVAAPLVARTTETAFAPEAPQWRARVWPVLTSLMVLAAAVLGAACVLGLMTAAAVSLAAGVDNPLLGVAVGVAGVVALMVVGVSLTLLPSVVGLTGRGGLFAVREANRWMAPPKSRLRVSLLLVLFTVLTLGLQMLLSAPRLAFSTRTVSQLAQGGTPSLLDLPVWAAIPLFVVDVVALSALLPIGAILITRFAFDVRIRSVGRVDVGPTADA